jgi:N-hydroxyarylamine O-acetyltransferase
MAPFHADAYFARVGHAGSRNATHATLDTVHLAHATTIPFENLDIFLGRPIRTDLESVQAKLVHAHRGGYCFEQNTLFAAMLRHLGFAVTCLAARVRLGSTRLLPRTHMVLKVEAEGRPWLADVGFGTGGLIRPIAFAHGAESQQSTWHYRLVNENGLWVLQSQLPGGWLDLYAFTEEPQEAVDYEVANHYVSTHPDSRFTQTLTVQRSALDVRYRLANREWTVTRAGVETLHTLADEGELLRVLEETFGLPFPAGTHFRSLLGHAPFPEAMPE